MTYLKGKDIKVPFDCLWHYFTRRYVRTDLRPEGFEKW